MRSWLVTSCLLALSGAACQRAPYSYQPLPAAATSSMAGTPAGPQLLFLSFNMSTDATGSHQLEPLLVQAVPGQASPVTGAEARGPSYLLLTQLRANGQPCGPGRRIPHPLVKEVEVPPEPGSTVFRRQTTMRRAAEFFVRLPRLPQAQAVRFEEVGPAAPRPISVVFPLPN